MSNLTQWPEYLSILLQLFLFLFSVEDTPKRAKTPSKKIRKSKMTFVACSTTSCNEVSYRMWAGLQTDIIWLITFFFWESRLWTLLNSRQICLISTECDGTSSIHTWKPVTWRACLTRLWATLFPSLRTCENLIQWNKFAKHLTSWIGKPKDAKECDSSFKVFITIF